MPASPTIATSSGVRDATTRANAASGARAPPRPTSEGSSRRSIAGACESSVDQLEPALPRARADGAPCRTSRQVVASRRISPLEADAGRGARRRQKASPITQRDAGLATTSPVADTDPHRAFRRARAQLAGDAQRAQRVVLVRERGAEHHQRPVAAQLGDAAAVARAGGARRVVVALEQRAQGLRVDSAAGRRAGRTCRSRAGGRPAPGPRAGARRAGAGTSWRRIAASSARSSGDGSMPSPSTSAS